MPRDSLNLIFPSPRTNDRVIDLREEVARLSKKSPRDPRGELAFLLGKRHLIQTQPGISPQERRQLLQKLEEQFQGQNISPTTSPPVPGGVGYGMFYIPSFKNNFATGTGIYWEIICPQPPGGNITDYFYLTGMNRASRGLEAFISYQGQTQTFFKVFDWSRPDHWQTNLPFASLAPNFIVRSAHGTSYQVLPVLNMTIQKAAGDWYNQVFLWQSATSAWALIYQHDYVATLADQQDPFLGSWGPIVETFQPAYAGTSLMGPLQTQLLGCNAAGVWGEWHMLGASDSSIRDDHKGFGIQFLDANHSWGVTS